MQVGSERKGGGERRLNVHHFEVLFFSCLIKICCLGLNFFHSCILYIYVAVQTVDRRCVALTFVLAVTVPSW